MSNNTHTFRELLPNKSKDIFRVYIKHYWHFEEVTPKQYYMLFRTSSNTDIFNELLPSNSTHFSRQQTILTFSDSYWQTILHNFPKLTSNNIDIFRELLANNFTHFSWVYIKQYWHFQRAPSKLNYSKKYHTILTLSESYYQTIIDLFRAHIKQYSHFPRVITKKQQTLFESFNRHLNRKKIQRTKRKFPFKSVKS